MLNPPACHWVPGKGSCRLMLNPPACHWVPGKGSCPPHADPQPATGCQARVPSGEARPTPHPAFQPVVVLLPSGEARPTPHPAFQPVVVLLPSGEARPTPLPALRPVMVLLPSGKASLTPHPALRPVSAWTGFMFFCWNILASCLLYEFSTSCMNVLDRWVDVINTTFPSAVRGFYHTRRFTLLQLLLLFEQ
ncbi:hypothetical protein C0Q70_00732 [Pomacea canaliculata]|uniref:Uncharacterized protein n=1 Tax=Pomacea canaliculata TaxID=400727 RepID=A0A2T7PXG3_POMCA|nr:hypothetical protein C0Q70_00732 [Pomacea canaliculata]